ncbi:hypothetical protein D3OALGA1CA_5085 [Olavius algarvensis associated proteobacterium Delta 3]|nr:hypothetical protein D3OALGA1CA_5085 [Olavius algarvensis associated proteobacterium Delta 3]
MADQKMFSTRIDPKLQKDVKILSVKMDKSISQLTEEAFKDLLKKYGAMKNA